MCLRNLPGGWIHRWEFHQQLNHPHQTLVKTWPTTQTAMMGVDMDKQMMDIVKLKVMITHCMTLITHR